MLIERETENGTTTVLIDTSPDMREQLLALNIGHLDAVVYTHNHADHLHGIDDLRMIVFNTRQRIPVWADGATQNDLLSRFGYAFIQPKDSPYPPILELNTIDETRDFTIGGRGGDISFTPIRVDHGSIDALAFRVQDLVYMPDVADIYDDSWVHLEGMKCFVVDALRRKPHPTHAHLEKTLEWIKRTQPVQAVLTNMHIDLDYDAVQIETPDHVTPAFDGMKISFDF